MKKQCKAAKSYQVEYRGGISMEDRDDRDNRGKRRAMRVTMQMRLNRKRTSRQRERTNGRNRKLNSKRIR